MLETLAKMSGVRHKTYRDTKTITQDTKALLKMAANEGKTSYTMTTKEEAVVTYNDLAFIPERNSIVFRAGDSPIWNKNETILPMSWRLFKNTIIHPGKEYTLMTIPTLSTAIDFDVRKNQPNFQAMLEKRMAQANLSLKAQETYKAAYGYSDYEIEQLDPDNYADEIMDLIYSTLNPEELKEAVEAGLAAEDEEQQAEEGLTEMFDYVFGNTGRKGGYTEGPKSRVDQFFAEHADIVENSEQVRINQEMGYEYQEQSKLRYAEGTVSRDMLVSRTGVNHALDGVISQAYVALKEEMDYDSAFLFRDGVLYGAKDGKPYIMAGIGRRDIDAINRSAKDPESRVYAEEEISEDDIDPDGLFVVTDNFLRFLTSFAGEWPFAHGQFAHEVAQYMKVNDPTDKAEAMGQD